MKPDILTQSIPTTDPVVISTREPALPPLEHLSTAGMPIDHDMSQNIAFWEGVSTATIATSGRANDAAAAADTKNDESFAAIISPPTTPDHSCSFLQDYW